MKKIKEFFGVLKLYHRVSHMGPMLEIVASMFKFVNDAKEQQRPLLTHIALVNIKDGTNYGNMIDIWAGVGPTNPIQRLEQLVAQRNELLRIVQKVKKVTGTGLDADDLLSIKCIELAS